MNILIKLTCLVGLVIAPILGELAGNEHSENTDETPVIEETHSPITDTDNTLDVTDMISVSE